jgi:hypothetical protein
MRVRSHWNGKGARREAVRTRKRTWLRGGGAAASRARTVCDRSGPEGGWQAAAKI